MWNHQKHQWINELSLIDAPHRQNDEENQWISACLFLGHNQIKEWSRDNHLDMSMSMEILQCTRDGFWEALNFEMDGKRVSYTSSIFASACQVVSKSGIFIYCNCSSNSNHLKCVVPETSLPTARQIEIQEANHSKTTFIYPDLKVVYGSSLISSVMCLSITSNTSGCKWGWTRAIRFATRSALGV